MAFFPFFSVGRIRSSTTDSPEGHSDTFKRGGVIGGMFLAFSGKL